MKNGRPSTQPMAKAPGGGTDAPMTGSLNRNLETGPCSTIQKELPNGVILTDAVSMPSWTHGELMKTMKMAGRPLTTQMEGAHGGGTNIQKIGSLSQNLGTRWQPLILGTINHIGFTKTDATSVPHLNPGSSKNTAMISDKLLHWIRGVCAAGLPWCSPLPVSSHSQWVPADQPSAQPGPRLRTDCRSCLALHLVSLLHITNQDRDACLQASLGAPPIPVTEISPKAEDIIVETSNKNTGCSTECPHMVDPHQPDVE